MGRVVVGKFTFSRDKCRKVRSVGPTGPRPGARRVLEHFRPFPPASISMCRFSSFAAHIAICIWHAVVVYCSCPWPCTQDEHVFCILIIPVLKCAQNAKQISKSPVSAVEIFKSRQWFEETALWYAWRTWILPPRFVCMHYLQTPSPADCASKAGSGVIEIRKFVYNRTLTQFVVSPHWILILYRFRPRLPHWINRVCDSRPGGWSDLAKHRSDHPPGL